LRILASLAAVVGALSFAAGRVACQSRTLPGITFVADTSADIIPPGTPAGEAVAMLKSIGLKVTCAGGRGRIDILARPERPAIRIGDVVFARSLAPPQTALRPMVPHSPTFDAPGRNMEALGPGPDLANVAVERMLKAAHGASADSRSSHRVLRSALIGFGIGAAMGFVVVGVQGSPHRYGPFGGASVLQLAGIGVAAGGALGAVIGAVAATISE